MSRGLLLASLTLLLTGCLSGGVTVSAPAVTPSTYRPAETTMKRTVGLLRRIRILPLAMSFSPANGKKCGDSVCDWGKLENDIGYTAGGFLKKQRGYEVSTSQNEERQSPELAQLVTWTRERKDLAPPEQVRNWLQRTGEAAGADGILLLTGTATALTNVDYASWYLTFSLAIPVSMTRIGIRLEAYVFETRSGMLVWASEAKQGGDPVREGASRVVDALLDPIEPALPKVFTLPEK